jgi:urease accessory protein
MNLLKWHWYILHLAGNLPTGAFVASAGLESYIKHGHPIGVPSTAPMSTINFMRDSLQSYALSAIPFACDTHQLVERYKSSQQDSLLTKALKSILELDELYDKMTLNHVARRASKTQGVALLTLYSRGFSRPAFLDSEADQPNTASKSGVSQLVDTLKLTIRKGETSGHLPICWGVLTSALGLSTGRCPGISLITSPDRMVADRSMEVHLFLHARSILSSAIRLNTLGPYSAQQLLLHIVKPLVRDIASSHPTSASLHGTGNESDGPANTWPLGEILATRHDLQHSRIFNS